MAEDILEKILSVKREEIAVLKQIRSAEDLLAEANARKDARGFAKALRAKIESKQNAVIAEIKKASPSKGVIRENFNPSEIAVDYAAHGATCLSVLTDKHFFQGSPDYLRQARAACPLPVLRKDFMTTIEQLQETADLGAKGILLIAALVNEAKLAELFAAALALGLEPLVEVHNEEEIRMANKLSPSFLGINNRNIMELEKDGGNVSRTERLAKLAYKDAFIISESAINSPLEVMRSSVAGAHGVLVGTAILTAPDEVKMYQHLSQVKRGDNVR